MILFKEELKDILQSNVPSKKKPRKGFKLRFNKASKVKPISFKRGALIFIGLSWFWNAY